MHNLLKKAILPLAFASTSLPVAACGSQPFVGEICTFAFNFCPQGFAETSGQLLDISQNTALFSLLGTTYGGNGQTTFALPDLRGRLVVGAGAGAGLTSVALGEKGGQQSVTLTSANLPTHTHGAATTIVSSLRGTNAAATSAKPQASILAKSGAKKSYKPGVANVTLADSSISSTATTVIGAAGSNQAFDNRQPYLGMTTCIALQGVFPARN
jgi:microcystin-dependent protein